MLGVGLVILLSLRFVSPFSALLSAILPYLSCRSRVEEGADG